MELTDVLFTPMFSGSSSLFCFCKLSRSIRVNTCWFSMSNNATSARFCFSKLKGALTFRSTKLFFSLNIFLISSMVFNSSSKVSNRWSMNSMVFRSTNCLSVTPSKLYTSIKLFRMRSFLSFNWLLIERTITSLNSPARVTWMFCCKDKLALWMGVKTTWKKCWGDCFSIN